MDAKEKVKSDILSLFRQNKADEGHAFNERSFMARYYLNSLLSKCYVNKFNWLEGSSVGNVYLKFVSNWYKSVFSKRETLKICKIV
jgi:hypothetical protein